MTARFPHSLATLLLAAAIGAQTEAPPAPAGASRALTREQIAERLEKVKTDLVPKVISPKIAGDEQAKAKYLARWQAVTSEHYLLFTNGPATTCKKYATSLERIYAYVQKELPFADVDHLLTCYIFATPEEYYSFCVAVTGWTAEEARATAGHATTAYYATWYQSPTAPVVFHEATHQIVGACLKVPGVGSWFQEGLAVYFEKKTSGEKPAGTIKNDFKRGDHYPLTEFFAIPVLLSDPKGNGSRNYAQAGALLDFLINTKLSPVAGRFPKFLEAARAGRGFGRGAEVSAKLVQDVYGLTVPELEALWKQHATK